MYLKCNYRENQSKKSPANYIIEFYSGQQQRNESLIEKSQLIKLNQTSGLVKVVLLKEEKDDYVVKMNEVGKRSSKYLIQKSDVKLKKPNNMLHKKS